jgi:Protein of unknown function (DUF1501)
MLTIFTGVPNRDRHGLSRRDFLRVGALTAGGCGLADLLAARAGASASHVSTRSVVFLWLGGGPSQIETFDPKMTAPDEIRSCNGEVKTTLPGVTIGASFPELARRLQRVALVRSFATGSSDHARGPKTVLAGIDETVRNLDLPSMGSVYARLRGTTDARSGMPTYTLLTAPEIAQEFRYQKNWLADGATAGRWPTDYGPFHPDGEITGGKDEKGQTGKGLSPLFDDMRVKLPADRLDDRRSLLTQLDNLCRLVDGFADQGAIDKFRLQAHDVIRGGVLKAFDLGHEDRRLVERYDTSMFKVGHKKGGYSASTLGKQMLLARRLCEAGSGFVLVQNSGWDMHDDGNNCGMNEGMAMLGPPLDRAVSAFLDDVEQRGLSDQILLVVTGEMGRTPKKQGKTGRNHWSSLAPLLLAGGGLKMGQVIGESDKDAGTPRGTPIRPSNLMATVLQTLLEVGQLRVQGNLPRELLKMVEVGRPIAELT